MTYRDGTLYNNIVKKAPFYPLNSIMTVGIAYANLGLPMMCINDSIADFSDMVWSYFGSGSALQELYISPDRMKPDFWKVLADGAKWAKENEKVFGDTHWIGGSPLNMEVYGFASWIPQKGIITLRNPDDTEKTINYSLDRLLEIPQQFRGKYLLREIKGCSAGKNDTGILSGDERQLVFKPFELKILEAVPF